MSPGEMDEKDVLRQLSSAGVLDTIKIRKSGYPIRRTHKEFYEHYNLLIGKK